MTGPILNALQRSVLKEIVRNGYRPGPHPPSYLRILHQLAVAGCIVITDETTPRVRATDLGRKLGDRNG